MLIEIPNGLIDGYELFNYVLIDELKGSTQNYLVNSALVVNNIGHIPKILGDMILSFQTKEGMPWKGKITDAIDLITSGDIETILIRLRENTYGPKFHHEALCSHCGHHHKNLMLNLSELVLSPITQEEMTNFMCSTLEKLWTKTNRGIAFNCMSKILDYERDDLFHVSFDELSRWVYDNLSSKFTIRQDYGLREFTMYVYK